MQKNTIKRKFLLRKNALRDISLSMKENTVTAH
jgi:hypothetical protein